jgi:ribosome recycling factor
LNHTALEREEVIRGLEERVEDGKIAIHGLRRKLLLSIRRRIQNSMVGPGKNGGRS